jgi:collagenase-like PrtC family protease
MKILSPLKSYDEAKILDADYFYCGLICTDFSLNDRPNDTNHNFSTIEELSKAVKIIKKRKKKIFLAINNMSLNVIKAKEQIAIGEKIGFDGYIISNPLLIKELPDKFNWLSCISATLNGYSIKYFQKLGINNFHLPRHLGIDEVNNLKKKEINLSVFGMKGMCRYIEGYCALHSLGGEHPCCDIKVSKIFGKEIKLNHITSPTKSCGICAFKQLKINCIKIEGRSASLKEKIKLINIIKMAL